jgi:hypothetical protein
MSTFDCPLKKYTTNGIDFKAGCALKNANRGGIAVPLPDEPKGWRRLQAKALQERNPEKLALIIDRMNELLDEHERMAVKHDAGGPVSLIRTSD